MTDLNMRKSWRAVYHRFRPDYVVFLGDMMDNGRLDMSHEEYVDQFTSLPDLMFVFQVREVSRTVLERVSSTEGQGVLRSRES